LAPSFTKIAILNDFSPAPPSQELSTKNSRGNSNGGALGRWPSGRRKKDPARFDEALVGIKNLGLSVYELLRE
jgi:hypothetical protein